MPERTVSSSLWTDPKVKALSADARFLFVYLITNDHGHYSGLYHLPVYIINRETGLTESRIERGLADLEQAGIAAYDLSTETVWVVNMLRRQTRSPKLMAGVEKHVAHIHSEKLVLMFSQHYGYPIDTLSIPYAQGIDTLSIGCGYRTVSDTDSVTASSGDPDAHGNDMAKAKITKLAKHQQACAELWALQEDLRKQAIPGSRTLTATDERLTRIAERLDAGATREDCEHVLRVYAHEARTKPDSAQWFNGETNWRKDNFERSLGRTLPAQARPRASPVKAPQSTLDLINADEGRAQVAGILAGFRYSNSDKLAKVNGHETTRKATDSADTHAEAGAVPTPDRGVR